MLRRAYTKPRSDRSPGSLPEAPQAATRPSPLRLASPCRSRRRARHTETRDEPLDAEHAARRRLALAQIRQYPDPVLRMRAHEVEEFDDDLRAPRRAHDRADEDAQRGRAGGNQAGVLRRIVRDAARRRAGARRAIVNPESSSAGRDARPTRRAASRSRACSRPVERATTVTRRRARPRRRPSSPRARGARGARRAARARPPRRDPDPRPHDDGGAPRGARAPAAAARPGSCEPGLGVAATAPFGADVLERLAAQPRRRVPAHPPGPRRAAAAGASARRRRRRRRSGSASRCASRSGSDAEFELDVPTRSSSPPTGCSIPSVLLDRALWLNVHPSLLPALARCRARRARDHGRRHRDRRDDPPHDRGARCRADRGPGRRSRSGRTTTPAPSTRGPAGWPPSCSTACSPRPCSRRAADEGATYAEKIDRRRPRARLVDAEDVARRDPGAVAAHRRAHRGRTGAR